MASNRRSVLSFSSAYVDESVSSRKGQREQGLQPFGTALWR
jgi:hypothetical protein